MKYGRPQRVFENHYLAQKSGDKQWYALKFKKEDLQLTGRSTLEDMFWRQEHVQRCWCCMQSMVTMIVVSQMDTRWNDETRQIELYLEEKPTRRRHYHPQHR